MLKLIKALIKSMRPLQWTKNFFVFAGLIFSQEFLQIGKFLISFQTFWVFCLLASGTYIFNDLIDIKQDRLHPTKRFRSLPSGELPVWLAVLAFAVFTTFGVIWGFNLDSGLGYIALFYVFLQVLYTLWLKHLVVIDLMVVATGFLLRAAGGAVVINVVVSNWLLLCTSLLALFMVTAKRRQELFRINKNNSKFSRSVLKRYNLSFLDQILIILVASTLTSYSLYVFDPGTAEKFGTPNLGFSLPFVIYGLFRYLYLVKVSGRGESPERLVISDLPFIINMVLWVLVVMFIIYFS